MQIRRGKVNSEADTYLQLMEDPMLEQVDAWRSLGPCEKIELE